MNTEHVRKLLAEGVIGLAVVGGAYMTLVDPVRGDLEEARGATADQNGMRAQVLAQGGGFDRARAALVKAQQRAALVHESGEAARDELIAFERLSQHAAESGATVEQLQQRDLKQPAGQAQAAGAGAGAGATMLSAVPGSPAAVVPKDVLVGFTMTVEGTYDSLITLVERLSAERESTAIESLTITPAGDAGRPRVRAVVRTVHYAFDASRSRVLVEQALARLGEAEAAR
jgi:hypothetical protein